MLFRFLAFAGGVWYFVGGRRWASKLGVLGGSLRFAGSKIVLPRMRVRFGS